MSQNATVAAGGMSRRSFLKKGAGLGLVVLVAGGAGSALLSGCAAAIADLTVTTSTDFNHSHKVVILGADIGRPPGEKTYVSDGATHQHNVTLKKSDFAAVRGGQEVTVVTTSNGRAPGHTHTCAIRMA